MMRYAFPYERALREMEKSDPDLSRAKKLLERARSIGDARATYALATWHLHGRYVPKNSRKAVALLEKAAVMGGVPDAWFDLAVCYETGVGVRKNDRRAFRSYLKATMLGDTPSIFEVGRCFYYGIGTRKDRWAASVYLERAKSLGIYQPL